MQADEPYWHVIECKDTDADEDFDECLIEDAETGARGRVPVVVSDGRVLAVWTWAAE